MFKLNKKILYFVSIFVFFFIISFVNKTYINEGFESTKNISILTLYYAPWCPHSKTFLKEWEILRKKYSERISMVSIDCSTQVNKPICKQKGIENVPSLMYQKYDINSSKYLDEELYKGDLEHQSVSNLIENKLL